MTLKSAVLPVAALLCALPGFGQSVISARAGVVHYLEGEVKAGKPDAMEPVEARVGGRYTEVKEGQALATGLGRAEILLNPGVFLRLGEDSAIQMISTRLVDTRLELTKGVALIEVAEVNLDNNATILVGDTSVQFRKPGLVRLEAGAGVRVYKGEAELVTAQGPQTLKDGREFSFATQTVAKFDAKQGDSLYRWANRRAEYIAMANIASANMVRQSGSSFANSGWFYNPYYGMMTYLPGGRAVYASPFGYMFYSPARVYRIYEAQLQPAYANWGGGGVGSAGGRTWNSNNGYFETQSRSAGPVSLPSMGGGAAATASAPPAARGAEAGVSRGGGGGRGGR